MTEPIKVKAKTKIGNDLTGATDLYVRIMRCSDDFFLDWDDMTFKSSGWTTINKLLTEVDATNAPGLYKVTGGFDTSLLTNPTADDNLIVMAVQTPGTNAVLPECEELKIDQYLTQLKELWYVHGLDPNNELCVDASTPAGSRKVPAAGTIIDQTVNTTGKVTKVTRV